MSEKLIGGVLTDPDPAPTLTELAAPVLLMAEAFVGHQVSVGQSTKADENVAALVAFKRALKEVDVPAPTFTVPPTEMPANDMARLEHRTRMRGELLNGLARAINATSTENASNTPDFILANFAAACLDAFAEASMAREAWYGKSLSIGGESATAPTAQDALIAEAREFAARAGRFEHGDIVGLATYIEELADALTASERLSNARAKNIDELHDAIARAERAERERDAEKASHFNSLTKWAAERDTLRQQLAEAREELAGLGPVERECDCNGPSVWMPCKSKPPYCKYNHRLIRRVLHAKEASDDAQG